MKRMGNDLANIIFGVLCEYYAGGIVLMLRTRYHKNLGPPLKLKPWQ
jgi:hypothetical protein